ncbi:hypothetical protein TNCV_1542211 [Trichonephila clavipes]|nr:hypothetical protein TNCV_1542211 [Trichonephila clavipes]
MHHHPLGIVFSDADYGFKSWRRYGFLLMYSAFAVWGTLNSCQAASPLVRLVKGEEMWKTPDHSQRVLPHNWGGTKRNRTIT